ncbi:MAG: DinB family protein [Ginsengibacter sp.]
MNKQIFSVTKTNNYKDKPMKIYTSQIHRFKSQHLTVGEIIHNLSPERMLIRPAPDKWNIHDNIAHLAKSQITFRERISKILSEDAPHFERYKPEDDPEFEAFTKRSVDDLLKYLDEERIKFAALIYSLSEKELERVGVHKKYGQLNIVQWIEFFLLHEAHHIFTIFQLTNDTDLIQERLAINS